MSWLGGALGELFGSVSFIPKRSIAGFTATVTLEEKGTDTLILTEHPVQSGASITDHAYVMPAQLSITAQWDTVGAGMPLEQMYARILEVQSSRIPFDVITGKRVYKNMLFKSIALTTDSYTDHILSLKCDLQEIIIVEISTTTVPPRAQQKKPGRTSATDKAGKKSAQPVTSPEKSQSALKIIRGGL